jgi:hypothetical protein
MKLHTFWIFEDPPFFLSGFLEVGTQDILVGVPTSVGTSELWFPKKYFQAIP